VDSRYLGKKQPSELEKDIQERRLIKRQLKEVAGNLKMLARLERRKRRG